MWESQSDNFLRAMKPARADNPRSSPRYARQDDSIWTSYRQDDAPQSSRWTLSGSCSTTLS